MSGVPRDRPGVAVIVPAREAAATLAECLDAVLAQDYPGVLEIVVAVGPPAGAADDGTAAIARRHAACDRRVRVLENPAGTTPAALNRAIRASTAPIVARVDAHAVLPQGYLARAVEVLEETGAVNVGGVQEAVGQTPFEQAVAAAMRSPAGAGGAAYRTPGPAGPVDTVYLGVFRREALVQAGGFDERLLRNQDYELNIRLRRAGGVVWFDPDLRVRYRPRATLRSLARQYHDYGRYKRLVARLHPGRLRARQVAPPAVVVASFAGLALAPFARLRTLTLPAVYLAGVTLAGLAAGRDLDWRARRWVPLVLVTMHIAWGLGFLRGPPFPLTR